MRIHRNCLMMAMTIISLLTQSLLAQRPGLTDVLKQNRYTITQSSQDKLEGNGIDFLIDQATSARFFLIGERRFTEEIPTLISKLHNSFYPLGYDNLALEIGPTAAKELEYLIKRTGINSLNGFFSKMPGSIPYYDHIEEGQLVADAVERGAKIWGLDQESGSSARLLFQNLQALSKTKGQKKLATKLFDEAQKGYKNDSLLIITGLNEERLSELKRTFKNNDRGLEIIERLVDSWKIYALFQNRQGYQSNATRNNLFKTYFHQLVQAIRPQSSGKVLLKVSSLLAGKGRNDLGFYSLGNFASEYAKSINSETFHLLITGKVHLRDGKERKLPEIDPELSVLEDISSPGETTVFDLRPLRRLLFFRQLKDVPEDLVKVIHAYDAILVVPKMTHALEKFD